MICLITYLILNLYKIRFVHFLFATTKYKIRFFLNDNYFLSLLPLYYIILTYLERLKKKE